MGHVESMAVWFLVAISFGSYFFHFLATPSLTGGSFIKVLSWICAGLLAPVLIINLVKGDLGPLSVILAVSLILLISYGAYFSRHDERTQLSKSLHLLIVILSMLVMGSLFQEPAKRFYFVLSFLLIGCTNYAMILGHWYLVTPKLSVAPLLNASKFLWIIGLIKILSSIPVGLKIWPTFFEAGMLAPGASFEIIVFLSRYLIGIIGLLTLSYFAYRLAKMRDTQSATGVFYVMVIFVFIGELCSYYFLSSKGLWP